MAWVLLNPFFESVQFLTPDLEHTLIVGLRIGTIKFLLLILLRFYFDINLI